MTVGRAGLRVRITVAACVVGAIAVTAGALGVVALAHRTLVDDIDAAARLRLADLAQEVTATARPGLLGNGDDTTAVQLVGTDGKVLASSPGVRSGRRLAPSPPTNGRTIVRTVTRPPVGDGMAYRVAARRVITPRGPVEAFAAASLEPATDSLHQLRLLLGVTAPLLVFLLTLGVWITVGRTLRPVEAIRRQVAAVSSAELDRRVPVPPSGDEVARLARTMNEMLDRLDRSARRQRRFVADASHELRSPLATARTTLDVALAKPTGADWPAVAARVQAEHDRLERLVDDLLLLARHDEKSVRRMPVAFEELLLREVADARARARVVLTVDAVEAARVVGDADGLTRIVRNLLDNADRHANAAVRVSLLVVDDQLQLTVTDDGPGIDPADRARVFERFTRLDDESRGQAGGVGLGLAIVRAVVTGHGGTVEVDDARPGARFVVVLPAVPDEVSDRATPTRVQSSRGRPR